MAGAGVMGLWTALHLRGRGLSVTVVDPWEPGHARGTSSSETRIIRTLYGRDALYTEWSWRSLAEWSRWEPELGGSVLHRTGVLWLARRDDGYEAAGEAELRRQAIPVEHLQPAEVRAVFPGLEVADLRFGVLEPQSGVLLAREAVRRLAALLVRRGGRILRGAAVLGRTSRDRLSDVRVGDTTLAAGAFVFACGPWLPRVFPDLLGRLIRVRRAEELFFSSPARGPALRPSRLPAWVEIGRYYGIPPLDGQPLKIGCDDPGPEFDPDQLDRAAGREAIEAGRAYLARRLPPLAAAPLAGSRVCTYELTPDEHLIIDGHPLLSNVWIVGGGSGHAFKMGPVIGEHAAEMVAGGVRSPRDARFRIEGRRARKWRAP